MALLEKQLRIKASLLPGAGKGLFTTEPIKKGTRIVEYLGFVAPWQDTDDYNGTNGYIYYVNKLHVIDARNHKEALARYANDAKGIARVKGLRNNCFYRIEGLHVYIVALKAIPAGNEILVGYGKSYWEAIRHNIKHGFLK
ncbi:SET domain-containing protein [Flavitalea flava]